MTRTDAKEPEKINMDGAMRYLGDLRVDLDDPAVMAIFELLDAPTMGEFERDKFISGWENVSSVSNPYDTIDRQAQYANTLRQRLQTDSSYFKQVYRAAFNYARPPGQRAVPVDDAFVYWDMFFRKGKGGVEWNTSTTKWMDLWNEFYRGKNNRPVNKDLWNQFCELVAKTKEGEGENLEWWSEDGAWPTAVDDFVAFVREKRNAGTTMDIS